MFVTGDACSADVNTVAVVGVLYLISGPRRRLLGNGMISSTVPLSLGFGQLEVLALLGARADMFRRGPSAEESKQSTLAALLLEGKDPCCGSGSELVRG